MRYSLVVIANAAMKHSFHRFLDCVSVAFGATRNDDAKPEAPRISPLKSNSVPADKPIRDPPRKPVAGVKELSDMNWTWLLHLISFDQTVLNSDLPHPPPTDHPAIGSVHPDPGAFRFSEVCMR